MKKAFALLTALVMCVSLVAIVASADDPVNVAAASTYEIHSLYQQQKESPWGWSDNPEDVVYGDETGKDLIDGKHAETAGYSDPQWVGMSSAHPDASDGIYLLFTLDQAYDVGTIVVTVSNLGASGIAAPSVIEAYYSEDGTEFKGGYEGEYTAELVEGASAEYRITLNKHTQYVKLVYTNGEGTWMFTDEVEIYNDGVIGEEPEESSEEPEESSEQPEESSEQPEESSEQPEEPSEQPDESKDSVDDTNSVTDDAGQNDNSWIVWVIIAVAVVAIAVVVFVIVKNKKH